METVRDFIWGGSKIIADGDCSHEIKRWLLFRRKAMTNLDNVKKQRHHFAEKSLSSQICGFSSIQVRMWELDHKEGWALLNSGAGEVPWTARRSNQWILKEINPEYSLEGLMLKLQYFGHLMQIANSLGKTLMLRNIESRRRRGWQRWDGWIASPTQWTWVWANSGR